MNLDRDVRETFASPKQRMSEGRATERDRGWNTDPLFKKPKLALFDKKLLDLARLRDVLQGLGSSLRSAPWDELPDH